jgi:hypothetical protein
MSGEIDITRGHTFTTANELVTTAKLNLLGSPTARVRAGSIGANEIDAASVAGALENVEAMRNHLRDPLFLGPWPVTSKVVTGGAARFVTRDWYVSPDTALATSTANREASTPSGEHGNRWAIKVTGSASNTGATSIGQLVPAAVAGALDDSLAISFWIKNSTGDAMTPSIRLLAATSADAWSTLAELYTDSTNEVANGQWAQITKVIDTTILTDWRNGGAFEVVFPAGSLAGVGQSVHFCMPQMEAGTAVSDLFIVPEARVEPKVVSFASSPGVGDDWLDGYISGDVWINSATNEVFICQNAEPSGAAVWKTTLGGFVASQYIHLQDRKAQNTDGDTATAGNWFTRVLNTECLDTGNNCSLASNKFTLAAGTYDIRAVVPGFGCNHFQARLYNSTDAAVVADTRANHIYGSPAYSINFPTSATAHSIIEGRFTLEAAKELTIQMQVSASRSTDGLGVAGNFATEIYTQVWLVKVA